MFRRRAYNRAVNQVDVHRYASDARNAIVLVKNAILHNKWAGSAVGLWIMGLLIVFVLPAPVSVTDHKMATYKTKAKLVEKFSGPIVEASKHMLVAEDRYLNDKVCFGKVELLLTTSYLLGPSVQPRKTTGAC
jgi:hypothetical protein